MTNVFKKLVLFLFLLQKTCCTLIFLSVKLLHCFFSSWNRFCSWNLLCADFSSWNLIYLKIFPQKTFKIYYFKKFHWPWYFSSWNLFHIGFFFVKYDACQFLFVKLVVYSLVLQESQCILIFVCEKLALFFFHLH